MASWRAPVCIRKTNGRVYLRWWAYFKWKAGILLTLTSQWQRGICIHKPIVPVFLQVTVQYADSPQLDTVVVRNRLFVGGLSPNILEGMLMEDSSDVIIFLSSKIISFWHCPDCRWSSAILRAVWTNIESWDCQGPRQQQVSRLWVGPTTCLYKHITICCSFWHYVLGIHLPIIHNVPTFIVFCCQSCKHVHRYLIEAVDRDDSVPLNAC